MSVEPISAVVSLIESAFKTWRAVNTVAEKISNAQQNLQHWVNTTNVLKSISAVAEQKLRSGDVLSDTEQSLYEDIAKQLEEFQRDLNTMDEIQQSTIKRRWFRKKGGNVELALRQHLKQDHELVERVDRNIRNLSISMPILLHLERREGVTADSIIKGLSKLFPRSQTDEDVYVEEWKKFVDITRHVARKDLGTMALEPVSNQSTRPPSRISDGETIAEPEFFHSGENDPKELMYRYKAAQKCSDRLIDANNHIIAAEYQLTALEIRQKIHETCSTRLQLREHVEVEERYIRLLEKCSEYDPDYREKAHSRLDDLVHTVGTSQDDESCEEVWDGWWRIGSMYADFGHLEPAKIYLRRSLISGYMTRNPENVRKEVSEIAYKLFSVYEQTADIVDMEGFRGLLVERMGSDPTLARKELDKTAAWCKKRGFRAIISDGGLSLDPAEFETGNTPLHAAAHDMDIEERIVSAIVKEAVSKGFLASPDEYGNTALHIAVEKSNSTVLEKLLEIPPLMNVLDADKKTILHRCTDAIVLEMLLEKVTVVRRRSSVRSQHTAACDEPPIDINSQDKWGRTPLHSVARQGRLDLVQILIQHNANVNIASKEKQTPLLYVCDGPEPDRALKKDIIRALVNAGANIRAKDYTGWDAAQILSRQGIPKSEINRLLSSSQVQFLDVRSMSLESTGHREVFSTKYTWENGVGQVPKSGH